MNISNSQLVEIVDKIKEVFKNESRYKLRKHVDEFHDEEGKFIGDFVNFTILDTNELPPTFYSVHTPYDLFTKKDPQQALIWRNGKVLFNDDFTELAALRTGAMDSISLELSGINSLEDKNILIFGTGRTAKWSLRVLKAKYSSFSKVEYINSKANRDESFEDFCKSISLEAKVGSKFELGKYDAIFCHTNTKTTLLEKVDKQNLKQGTIITTYIGSDSDVPEVDDSFFSVESDIVLDWKDNLKLAKGIAKSDLKEGNLIYLKDLLLNEKSLNKKGFQIFRFLGTPMQNLAVLSVVGNRSSFL